MDNYKTIKIYIEYMLDTIKKKVHKHGLYSHEAEYKHILSIVNRAYNNKLLTIGEAETLEKYVSDVLLNL